MTNANVALNNPSFRYADKSSHKRLTAYIRFKDWVDSKGTNTARLESQFSKYKAIKDRFASRLDSDAVQNVFSTQDGPKLGADPAEQPSW